MMMKQFLTGLFLCAAAMVLPAADATIESCIPASADSAVILNYKMLENSSLMPKIRESNPDFTTFQDKLNEKAKSMNFVFKAEQFALFVQGIDSKSPFVGFLLKSNLTPEILEKVLKENVMGETSSYTKKTILGKTVYFCKGEAVGSAITRMTTTDQVAIVFAADQILLVTDPAFVERCLKGPNGMSSALAASIASAEIPGSLLKGSFKITPKANSVNPFEKVNSAAFSFLIQGTPEAPQIQLKALAGLADKEAADLVLAQIQQGVMMFAMTAGQKDPEAAKRIMSAVKVAQPKPAQVMLDVKLDQALINFMESAAAAMIPMSGI